ncbi:unnamed protein product [Cylicocyclus nassatus]|uniref:Uncharacterized protein n=1 Tax=Cylicocyclus nassatus TaxID=53992 RepID=A0AA36GDI5_CYLNA|nr:unnamed protein product [Cylicocyclus nassatus]
MMRIKEAIQRKKLIQKMNEDFKDLEFTLPIYTPSPIPLIPQEPAQGEEVAVEAEPTNENGLQTFVQYLSERLNENQV